MNLVGTILAYAGLLALFLGLVSLVRPLSFLGIAGRPRAIVVLLCGVVVFLIGANLPASEERIAARQFDLDDFISVYQFHEFHKIRVHARREDVFKALRAPGFALAAMNFQIEDSGSGDVLVTTETRVYATDAPTRRKFAAYWRVIYPGSALIRTMWLRAIKQRAEKSPG